MACVFENDKTQKYLRQNLLPRAVRDGFEYEELSCGIFFMPKIIRFGK